MGRLSDPAREVFLRVAAIVLAVFVGFALLQTPAREMDAQGAVWLLHALGVSGVASAPGAAIVVSGGYGFTAVVTASCSSLSALLALFALGLVAPRGRLDRKLFAVSAAMAVVVAGNIFRIAASVAVGLAAGPASLVLFHDWVGGIFTFAYILGGYVVMLYLLLPGRHEEPAPRHVSA
jgi:exosortase/archaeosortase family protein